MYYHLIFPLLVTFALIEKGSITHQEFKRKILRKLVCINGYGYMAYKVEPEIDTNRGSPVTRQVESSTCPANLAIAYLRDSSINQFQDSPGLSVCILRRCSSASSLISTSQSYDLAHRIFCKALFPLVLAVVSGVRPI